MTITFEGIFSKLRLYSRWILSWISHFWQLQTWLTITVQMCCILQGKNEMASSGVNQSFYIVFLSYFIIFNIITRCHYSQAHVRMEWGLGGQQLADEDSEDVRDISRTQRTAHMSFRSRSQQAVLHVHLHACLAHGQTGWGLHLKISYSSA